jgi:hypothetical protein
MNTYLEEFFKDTPVGIKSVMKASVSLAEKVNSRTDLSGKEKTELVVKSLVDFLGEGNPELVALVQGVIPGMLELVISTARGVFNLRPAKAACFAFMASKSVAALAPAAEPAPSTQPATAGEPATAAPATTEPASEAQPPATEERKPEPVPWSFFCVPFAKALPKALPKVTLREPV